MTLAEKLVAIHRALEAADINHAFGGAIALAFWTEEPRGTRDIDLNIFVPQANCERGLVALPSGVSYDETLVETIKLEGQARLWWGDTPVDVFFDNLPLHRRAARNRRRVPFEGCEIPILAASELALFKAMVDRTRDWADIEAMLEASSLAGDELPDELIRLAGPDDSRVGRLDETLARFADRG